MKDKYKDFLCDNYRTIACLILVLLIALAICGSISGAHMIQHESETNIVDDVHWVKYDGDEELVTDNGTYEDIQSFELKNNTLEYSYEVSEYRATFVILTIIPMCMVIILMFIFCYFLNWSVDYDIKRYECDACSSQRRRSR